MLPTSLKALLKELETFGINHDAAPDNRTRRLLNITHDTGEFLAVLVRAMGARRVLEIGTSNGYSTLWLAEAAQGINGSVTTVELSAGKVALARENFARASLQDRIVQVEGQAADFLANSADESFDLIFLDAERSAYLGWLPQIERILRPGGLVVVDNATSHAQELAPFIQALRCASGWSTSLVPVGKGEFLATKH
ncbi:O-methyltransferase [Massilia sp. CFBP9026]|uniref:O-methyltransferase n=1 Tax=Massilia sp. CFBP9026 TaxID=3096536 RepID=UPI002A6A9B98|nr:O-methyltransferase [Massilia sp. CFBP9026]MDY0964690.1 O-methyltransferase [Massilia sp. CFBP9026]